MSIYKFYLQLFGEGGDAAPAGDNGSTGVTEQAAAAPEVPVYKKRQGINRLDRQKPVQQTAPAEQPAPDVDSGTPAAQGSDRASFDELIKGDYKKDFDDRVQDIVRRRMKGTEKTKQRLDSLEPVVKLLAEKYGLAADGEIDPQSIMDAIMDDNAMWEEKAMQKNMTVDEYKEWNKEHRDYERLKQEESQRQQAQASQSAFNTIMEEANALKTKYPDLDFGKEMADKKFCEEVAFYQRRGDSNPFQRAYESRHFDELMSRMATTAQKTSIKQVADAVAANKARPAENGAAQSGIATMVDPSKFKKKDFEDIKKRMLRGEKVTF